MAVQIAERCGLSAEWLHPLLGFLQRLGLVSECQGRFGLTDLGPSGMRGPGAYGILRLSPPLLRGVGSLPQCLEQEQPAAGFHRRRMADPAFCRAYPQSMDVIARANLGLLEEECSQVLDGRTT